MYPHLLIRKFADPWPLAHIMSCILTYFSAAHCASDNPGGWDSFPLHPPQHSLNVIWDPRPDFVHSWIPSRFQAAACFPAGTFMVVSSSSCSRAPLVLPLLKRPRTTRDILSVDILWFIIISHSSELSRIQQEHTWWQSHDLLWASGKAYVEKQYTTASHSLFPSRWKKLDWISWKRSFLPSKENQSLICLMILSG